MNEEKIIFRIKVDVVSLKTIVQFRSCQQLNNNKRSWQCKEIELSTGNGPKKNCCKKLKRFHALNVA